MELFIGTVIFLVFIGLIILIQHSHREYEVKIYNKCNNYIELNKKVTKEIYNNINKND